MLDSILAFNISNVFVASVESEILLNGTAKHLFLTSLFIKDFILFLEEMMILIQIHIQFHIILILKMH